jgi:hypothetical protein
MMASQARPPARRYDRVGIRTLPRLWALALLFAAVVVWLGARQAFWGDYFVEAWPAYLALRAGGVHHFLALAPAYRGFAVLVGAPLALLGQGIETTLRLDALPGMLALAALGVALAVRNRRQALLVLALGAGSPVAFLALDAGHPEDVLAAAAAVLGILAALDRRPTASGVLLAVAVLAKQTAVLAILPALLALERPRVRTVAIPVLAAGLVYGGLHFLTPAASAGAGAGLAAGSYFHPWQVWWPFGVPSSPAWAAAGHGSVTSPAWLAPIPHPLIVALALPVSALWWRRAGAQRPREDALALFALLALERCLLDPWDLGYYHLPLVLALLAWECARRRPPLVTLATTLAVWITFHTLGDLRTGLAPMLLYLAWALPLGAALVRTLFLAPAPARRLAPAGA